MRVDCSGSPAMSASPPPAPPPQPPAYRSAMADDFSRCRFNQRQFNGGDRRDEHLTGTYAGYDNHHRYQFDEEDSICPALLEREFHSLHRNVPGLRRAGVDTHAIRQHFYPDGGWGWIICGVAFLAHVFTSGLQLSYGLLLLYTMRHLKQETSNETGWLGAASWSSSMIAAPIVIALCRTRSTRLTAILGGLVLSLGILFASFANQLHQIAFSYGIVVGVGASMVRESSAVMLGHYFKRRREFVEMVAMSGEGVGVALFSVIFKEGVGKMGWRLGLQAVCGLISCSFFMGLLYRPASLYHPQRRAILHLKNQRKKVKEKKTHIRVQKPPFLDFTVFRSPTVRMFIICTTVASYGIYAPIFFMSLHSYQEGCDVQDLVLLQTFLGLSIAFGIVVSGSAMNKICSIFAHRKFVVSRQLLCQSCAFLVALSTLVLSFISGYRNMCILAWIYGFGLGGYRYMLKMFALERIRAKHFTKAWGFIRGSEALPVIFGVTLTAILNDSSQRYGKAGYFICSAVAAISAILMFFIGHYVEDREYTKNGSIMSHCTLQPNEFPDLLNRSFSRGGGCGLSWYNQSPYTTLTTANNCIHPDTPSRHSHGPPDVPCRSTNGFHGGSMLRNHPLQKSLSFAFQTPPNYNGGQDHMCPSYHAATSTNSINRSYSRFDTLPASTSRRYQYLTRSLQQNPSRSRSVPEGLSQISQKCTCCNCPNCNKLQQLQHRYDHHQNRNGWQQYNSHASAVPMQCFHSHPIQIVEQITTSV